MQGIIGGLARIIIAVISGGGYLGIAALMAVESACIPLPSEVIMPFAGYLVSTGRFNLWLVATAGALGCNVGSAIAYWIGARGGRPFIARYGSWVLMDEAELDRVEKFFHRFGAITVLIGRVLPVVRTFIALPAGIARMNPLRFHLYTFAGSWVWCLVLAYVGMKLGQQWDTNPQLKSIMHSLDGVILLVLVLAIAWFVWSRMRHRRKSA